MKKKILLVIVIISSSIYLIGGLLYTSLAYLTDRQQFSLVAPTGTVEVSAPDLVFLVSDSSASEPVVSSDTILAWSPGDINTIQWTVENLGNKSVDLRYIMNIYWNDGFDLAGTDNEPTDSALWSEAPYIYLYPASMTDAEITADLSSGSPAQFIDIGTSNVQFTNAAGAIRYGYTYTFGGVTLDGVGHNAETGDAPAGASSDVQQFKIALSPETPAGFMNRSLTLQLFVEGKQHRNTSDSDWSLIGTQVIQ